MTTPLPEEFTLWYEKHLPPRRGGGLNDWLLVAARRLRREIEDRDMVKLILAPIAEAQGGAKPGEIDRQVDTAFDTLPADTGPRWHRNDQVLIKLILENAPHLSLQGLCDLSPARGLYVQGPQTERIIDALFPGNPLLCCGWAKNQFATLTRNQWRGKLAKTQFIVPAPPLRHRGLTQQGHYSAHCKEMMGERHYLIVEFDHTPLSVQPTLIKHLAERRDPRTDWPYFPLRLVVYSGSKSLHAWFDIRGVEEARALRFMRYAVSLGADPAPWRISHFVRTPDGRRDNGREQTVLYFSPENGNSISL